MQVKNLIDIKIETTLENGYPRVNKRTIYTESTDCLQYQIRFK